MNYNTFITSIKSGFPTEPKQIFPEFENAYNTDCSTLLIEWGDYYNEK